MALGISAILDSIITLCISFNYLWGYFHIPGFEMKQIVLKPKLRKDESVIYKDIECIVNYIGFSKISIKDQHGKHIELDYGDFDIIEPSPEHQPDCGDPDCTKISCMRPSGKFEKPMEYVSPSKEKPIVITSDDESELQKCIRKVEELETKLFHIKALVEETTTAIKKSLDERESIWSELIPSEEDEILEKMWEPRSEEKSDKQMIHNDKLKNTYYHCEQHGILYSFAYSCCPICYRGGFNTKPDGNPFKVGDKVNIYGGTGHDFRHTSFPEVVGDYLIGRIIEINGDRITLLSNETFLQGGLNTTHKVYAHYKQCELVEE